MSRAQAESVIKNIIREIAQECASKGQAVSETLVAFMVSIHVHMYSLIENSFLFTDSSDCLYTMSHVTRKPVFEVCDKVRFKPAC